MYSSFSNWIDVVYVVFVVFDVVYVGLNWIELNLCDRY